MKQEISTQVTEIKLMYRHRVLAQDRPQIRTSADAYRLFWDNWDHDVIGLYEEFHILLLDRSNRVMAKLLVSQGGMAGTVVDAKIVFATALKGRAAAIILAHNHPSTNLKPSQADRDLTHKLHQGGKFLDLPILDHLIISPNGGYFSFADEGLL